MATLRQDMDELAGLTLERVRAGDARGIRLREDTITEMNLLDLDIRHPNLAVRRFNQHEERSNGADWEWFIGSESAGWFGLRIQAKRADDGQYRQLGHEGADPDDYQYDTLIRSCGASTTSPSGGQPLKFFPYYVFFNNFDRWPSGAQWTGCRNGEPFGKCKHVELEHFGCSAAPAVLVRKVHAGLGIEGRRVAAHLSVQIPWSWLFGRPKRGKKLNGEPAPDGPSTLSVLAWHQAQEAAIERLRAADGPEGAASLGEQFWETVGTPQADEANREDLNAELPGYASLLRATMRRQGRQQIDELELFERLEARGLLLDAPRRITITDLDMRDRDFPWLRR